MNVQRPVEKTGAGAPGPVFPDGFDGRFLDLGVGSESEIIVGPAHDHFPAVHYDHRVLLGFYRPEVGIDPGLDDFVRILVIGTLFKDSHLVPLHLI